MSRQGFGQLGLLCRDMTFVSRQQHFSVELKSVATEFSLSRQGWPFGVETQSFGVVTRPSWLGSVTTETATERAASVSCAHNRAVLSCGTLHCVVQLFGSLFMGTVHEHCSRVLFKKNFKKNRVQK